MAAALVVQAIAAIASGGVVATVGRRLVRRAGAVERIDPFTLTDPWRSYVSRAQSAHARFGRVVGGADDGPLKERLATIDTRIGEGVNECWRIAQRGYTLHKTLLEVASSGSEAVTRMRAKEKDTQDHLSALIQSLDEAVARAAELATHRTEDLDAVADDVNGVVGDLEALRQAVVEVDQAAEPPKI